MKRSDPTERLDRPQRACSRCVDTENKPTCSDVTPGSLFGDDHSVDVGSPLDKVQSLHDHAVIMCILTIGTYLFCHMQIAPDVEVLSHVGDEAKSNV